MKVKELVEFLSHCDKDAEFLYEDNNGNTHQIDELDADNILHLDLQLNKMVAIPCVHVFFKDEFFK